MESSLFYFRIKALFLGFLLFMLAGTALSDAQGGLSSPTPSGDSKGFNTGKKKVLLKVPFERQTAPNLCGLAAVDMITGYFGKKLDKSQSQSLKMDADQDNGITGATLDPALRASGYYTAIFQGTLDHSMTGIYRDLELKRPLIVMVTSKDGKTSHYGVLTGYDSARQEVFLSDPAGQANESFTVDQFEAGWKRANYFTLLAIPNSQDTTVGP